MRAYWTDKKPDGTPITDGRLCYVMDPEDGSLAIRTYGRTQEEVLEKVSRTALTAQVTLTQARQPQNAPGGEQPPHQTRSAAPPAGILSPDDVMRWTAAQQDPGKSAEAAARLADHYRALQQQELQNFLAVCDQWQQRHPEMKDSLFNKKLIVDNARMRTGGELKTITADVLEQVYQELNAGGYLLTEEPAAPPRETQQPSEVPPGGIPDPAPARPRSGVVSTTGHRSTRLGAPAAPRWQPKFSLAEIQKLSTRETAELNKPNHPRHNEYVEACDYWYSTPQAATA